MPCQLAKRMHFSFAYEGEMGHVRVILFSFMTRLVKREVFTYESHENNTGFGDFIP